MTVVRLTTAHKLLVFWLVCMCSLCWDMSWLPWAYSDNVTQWTLQESLRHSSVAHQIDKVTSHTTKRCGFHAIKAEVYDIC